jgi:hypothetical protein
MQKSMKKISLLIIVVTICNYSFSQTRNFQKADSTLPFYEAVASCGSCKFNMKGNGCFMAIRFNEKNYLVQGAGIDDFGDAHDKDGFCNSIRKVLVQGKIKEDDFILSYLEFK